MECGQAIRLTTRAHVWRARKVRIPMVTPPGRATSHMIPPTLPMRWRSRFVAAAVMGCIACTTSQQASAFVVAPAAGVSTSAQSCYGHPGCSAASRVGAQHNKREIPVVGRLDSARTSTSLTAEGGGGGEAAGTSPLSAASKQGLVFPTEIQDGWFDSATVGSPRVHRCKTCQIKYSK